MVAALVRNPPIYDQSSTWLRIGSYAGRSAHTLRPTFLFDERRRVAIRSIGYRRVNDDRELVERTGGRRTLGRRVIAVFPPAFGRSAYRR